MDKLKRDQFLRLAFVVIIAGAAGYLVCYSWLYFSPFLIAFVFAWLIQPYVKMMEERFHFPRWTAVILFMLLGLSLVGGLAVLFIAEMVKGIQYLAAGMPVNVQDFIHQVLDLCTEIITPLLHKFEKMFHSMNQLQQHSVDYSLTLLKQKVSTSAAALIQHLLAVFTRGLASIPNSLSAILIGTLAAFFFCKDWEIIKSAAYRLLPPQFLTTGGAVITDLKKTMAGIVKAQFILMITSSIIVLIGLVILKFPHPLLLAVISGFVDFVPYVGTGIIFIPWIFYEFLTGSFDITIGLSLLYMTLVIVRQLLEPKLLAEHFGVPPVVLLIGLFAGYQLWGVYGIFLSPVIIAFLKTLHTTGVLGEVWKYISGT